MKVIWLFWLPRLLAILIIGLISLFALDVFESGLSLREEFLAFLIHLIPTFVLLALLFIAWKWPLSGGILFILAGGAYFFFAGGQHLSAYLLVGGIPALIGLLFITEHFLDKKRQALV
jgi:hypothetical protein